MCPLCGQTEASLRQTSKLCLCRCTGGPERVLAARGGGGRTRAGWDAQVVLPRTQAATHPLQVLQQGAQRE